MRQSKRVLGGNIMWLTEVEGLEGYIFSYFDEEKDEWQSKHIDNARNIFDRPFDEDLCMNLYRDQFELLIDNKNIYFDNKDKLYKAYFYDKIYPISERIVTEYIKSNKLDGELLSDKYKKEDYFKTLWGITINFVDNIVSFDGISGYIDEVGFDFDIDCISDIIDIGKLKKYADKIHKGTKEIYIPCMQYPISSNGEWYEETILTYRINADKYFTNKLFEDCNFIK